MKCHICDARVEKLMTFCPQCGEEQSNNFPLTYDSCPECEAPVSPKFNFCYCCGEELSDEWLDDVTSARGFKLEWECEHCYGYIQDYMGFCPSCGEEVDWNGIYGEDEYDYCDECGTNISEDWYYCVFCGEEIDWGEDENDFEIPPIAEKIKFWEEQDKINQVLIEQILALSEKLKKISVSVASIDKKIATTVSNVFQNLKGKNKT
jgi:predicted amidophosphoribosyltransferase